MYGYHSVPKGGKETARVHAYFTGLRTFPGELEREDPYARERYRGPNWEIRFIKCQTPGWQTKVQRKEYLQPRELIIRAPSIDIAQNVASLLFASKGILDGSTLTNPFVGWDPFVAYPLSRPIEREDVTHERAEFLREKRETFHDFCLSAPGFHDAALIASRLARRARLRNAAYKYLASAYLIRVDPIDLRPGETDPRRFRSSHPMDWVWFAQSIFAAYGVIEELRLTVTGASATKPSIRDDGSWDPSIRANLESRLNSIGIGALDTVLWHARGTVRRLERRAIKRITQSTSPSWSAGEVRDLKILYIDAINVSNMLRNNIVGHVGDIQALSAVDVANVQGLARMLLLHAIRFHFWKKTKVRRAAALRREHRKSF